VAAGVARLKLKDEGRMADEENPFGVRHPGSVAGVCHS
jgi:hypothetical protein